MTQGNEHAITFHRGSLTPINDFIRSGGVYLSRVRTIDRTGGSDTQGKILEIVNQFGTQGGKIVCDAGTYKISSNLTIPANITFEVVKGGLLSIDSGVTVTFNGNFIAEPRMQCFSGSGTVVFGVGITTEGYAEWWGAVADADVDAPADLGTDSGAAINAAMLACFEAGIKLRLLAGTYRTSIPLVYTASGVVKRSMVIEGAGSSDEDASQIWNADSFAGILLKLDANGLKGDIVVEKVRIYGGKPTDKTVGSFDCDGLEIDESIERVLLKDLKIDKFGGRGLVIRDTFGFSIDTCQVRDNNQGVALITDGSSKGEGSILGGSYSTNEHYQFCIDNNNFTIHFHGGVKLFGIGDGVGNAQPGIVFMGEIRVRDRTNTGGGLTSLIDTGINFQTTGQVNLGDQIIDRTTNLSATVVARTTTTNPGDTIHFFFVAGESPDFTTPGKDYYVVKDNSGASRVTCHGVHFEKTSPCIEAHGTVENLVVNNCLLKFGETYDSTGRAIRLTRGHVIDIGNNDFLQNDGGSYDITALDLGDSFGDQCCIYPNRYATNTSGSVTAVTGNPNAKRFDLLLQGTGSTEPGATFFELNLVSNHIELNDTFDMILNEALEWQGGSGENIVRIPANVADALHFTDDVGQMIRFDTRTSQRGLRINPATLDVDFTIEASGPVTAMFVKGSDGTVAIGHQAPLDILHIADPDGDTTVRIGGADAADHSVHFSGNADWSVGVDNNNSDNFTVSASDTLGTSTVVTLTAAGDLGIGQTSPLYGLSMGAGQLIQRSTDAGLTASTTQTQGGGLALTAEYNEFSTVANANDAATLITVAAGIKQVVFNNGANTLQIFPASGDDVGAGVDTSVTLAAGANTVFRGIDGTNWEQD